MKPTYLIDDWTVKDGFIEIWLVANDEPLPCVSILQSKFWDWAQENGWNFDEETGDSFDEYDFYEERKLMIPALSIFLDKTFFTPIFQSQNQLA